jgi:hypothetical protein
MTDFDDKNQTAATPVTKNQEKKAKLSKPKDIRYYLAVTIKRAQNKAVIIRVDHPHLLLYINKTEEHNEIIAKVAKDYFKDIAHLKIVYPEDDPQPPTHMMFQDRANGFYKVNIIFKFSKASIADPLRLANAVRKKFGKQFEHKPFVPLPHQLDFFKVWWQNMGQDIFKIGKKKDAFLLFWRMGLGKSQASLLPWSSIHVNKVYILCLKTMVETWCKFVASLEQLPNTQTEFEIVGLTEFTRLIYEDENYLKDQVVIFDEAHCFRNLTPVMNEQIQALRKSKSLFNLSGTPIVNARSDVIGIGKIMFFDFTPFDIDLLNSSDLSPQTTERILDLVDRIFRNKVHFCDPNFQNEQCMAPVKVEIREVSMTWIQTLDYLVSKKQTFEIGDISITSSRRNSYHVNEKRMSNSANNGHSPKFDLIVKDTLEFGKPGQILYSNFLGNGIFPIYKALKDKIPTAMATGDTPAEERDRAFDKYNSQEVDVLCLSSIGGIGLNFRNTKVLRFVDSFENLQLEQQAIARVSRIGAHDKKKKTDVLEPVIVIKYISLFPRTATDADSDDCRDYFYKTYCNEKWGTPNELFGTGRFIDFLLEKIQAENAQTIDQRLEKSNAIKQDMLNPILCKMANIGTTLPIRDIQQLNINK